MNSSFVTAVSAYSVLTYSWCNFVHFSHCLQRASLVKSPIVRYFRALFVKTTHINQQFSKCSSVSQLANLQLQSFGKMF